MGHLNVYHRMIVWGIGTVIAIVGAVKVVPAILGYRTGAKIVCMAFAALMFSLILIPAGYAAIGVEEGDWAKYGDIEAEIPEIAEASIKEIEEMEWVKAEVESVSDTTVIVEETIHYKNGTERTETIEDAIESGIIIEADLGEGDEVTAQIFYEMTLYINGTVSRTYAGASREVNYVDITATQNGMSVDYEAYWDKATGFLCEISVSMSGEIVAGQTAEMSMSYKMTETNVWEARGSAFITQWWFWAIVGVVIVALAAALYFIRKRKPPTPTAPTPLTEGTETSIE